MFIGSGLPSACWLPRVDSFLLSETLSKNFSRISLQASWSNQRYWLGGFLNVEGTRNLATSVAVAHQNQLNDARLNREESGGNGLGGKVATEMYWEMPLNRKHGNKSKPTRILCPRLALTVERTEGYNRPCMEGDIEQRQNVGKDAACGTGEAVKCNPVSSKIIFVLQHILSS